MIKLNIHCGIFGNDGYSSHSRSLFNALYKIKDLDIKINTQLPQDWIKQCSDAELDCITKPERKEDWNLVITIPHMWKLFLGTGKNACYCVWEGDSVPKSWIEEFENERVNLIFVPSQHTYDAIMKTLNEVIDIKFEYFQGWMINKYFPDNEKIKEYIINKIKIIPHGVDRSIYFKIK
jgi:hypothetical protein